VRSEVGGQLLEFGRDGLGIELREALALLRGREVVHALADRRDDPADLVATVEAAGYDASA
jgi:hypothetical protein